MASEILSKYTSGSFTHVSLVSLAIGSAACTLSESNPSPGSPQVEIFYQLKTGNVPAANVLIEFYIARSESTITDGDLAGTDTALTVGNFDKNQMQFVHAQVCDTGVDTYRGSFIVDHQGPTWQLVTVNETGIAFDSTGHELLFRYISPEVQ